MLTSRYFTIEKYDQLSESLEITWNYVKQIYVLCAIRPTITVTNTNK